MIHVVNRNDPTITERDRVVNIMRPNVFGNPYTVKQYGRVLSIRKFRRYMWERWKHNQNEFAYTLEALIHEEERFPHRNIYLVCCCKPLDCHGDKIVNFVEHIKGLRSGRNMFT